MQEKKSRLEKLKESKSNLVDMPEVDSMHYILDYLSEAGLYEQGMNGPMPLSWREIQSWSELTGTVIAAWESNMIRELSVVYCNQYHKSSDPNEPPPYTDIKASSESIDSRVLKMFRSHSKYRKKR